MQPQGLEALMQSQPAPQMNNPRLAAAMDVVTSDAEEQILDPRTLAMLKYKDALQAMQAADQMMASAQPAPTAPTVAERTKLAAEQGIAGLAQRLSPGVQQQGRQMAAQQAQQAMQGGGLPQLPAPNMAGMAGGGIVAFAKGGLPTAGARDKDEVVTYDELGNPVYASDIARALAAGTTDTSEEGAARRAAYAALQQDRPSLRDATAKQDRPSARPETPVPSSTYGAGDRTGQGSTLAGMGQGVASLISDAAGGSRERILQAMSSAPGAGQAGSALTQAYATGTGAAKPQKSEEILMDGAGNPISQSDFDRIMGNTQTSEEIIGTDGEGNPISQSDFDRIMSNTSGSGGRGGGPREMQQVGLGSAGSEDQRLVDMRRSGVNPNYAEAFKAPAVPPFEKLKTYLGGLGVEINDASSLQRVVDYAKANNSPTAFKIAAYLTAMGIDTGKVYSDVGQDIGAGVQMATQQVAEGVNAAREQAAAGARVARGLPPDAPASDVAATPTTAAAPATSTASGAVSTTPTATPAATAPARDAVETLLSQPSPREMGPNATPEQYFRSQFRPKKAQAESPASAGTSDDRYDRMLAGLRGLGSRGLGGYAAGSAEEKLRMEQEQLAAQERSSEEAFREREFGQKDREIEAINSARIAEATARAQDQAATLQFRYDQLNDAQRNELKAAYFADMRVAQANTKIAQAQAAIEEGPGMFGGAREHTAEQMAIITKEQETLANLLAEYMSQYQEMSPQSAPATTIDPVTQAALEQYAQ